MAIRTFSELRLLETFDERFDYLKLQGSVGHPTFGFDRYINQRFYTSRQWRSVRNDVIARDLGLDLGCVGHEIHRELLIHHMNPITPNDIVDDLESILDPEFLITTSHNTHNAIHYGDVSLIPTRFVERRPGDTRLWQPANF